MAANLKPKVTPPISHSVTRQERVVDGKKEIRLSIASIAALWALIAGMMVTVFFFGVHAGLEQGLKKALDEQQSTVVRLPLPPLPSDPVAPGQDSGAPAAGLGLNAGLLAADGLRPTVNSPTTNSPSEGFDFSSSAVPPSTAPDNGQVNSKVKDGAVVAGLTGRSTSDIISGSINTPIAKERNLDLPPKSNPLAGDSIADLAQTGEPAPEPSVKVAKTAAPVESKPSSAKRKEIETTKAALSKPTRVKAGYYIQVAAPTSRAEAESVLTRIGKSGIKGRVQEIRVDGVLYYRVLAGPERSRAKADSSRKKIASSRAVKGTPFVRYIGSDGR